ncbi:uncharacterized protein LOC135491544 [Lineus longissimus]|uniref:uncharacterized protein LOC135491544 n=1 Tax=Lineus longissimus TaxID=88925 RepID=UPI00315CAAC6
MSGANICETEEYKSAAGILKKCSVECINLIRGGDKDSLQNINCKTFCGDCYAYYSTKADTETTALPDFTSPSTAVTNPTTAIDATTALCPPCYETTLTVLVVLIPLITIVVIVIMIIASWIFKPVQNFWKKLLGIKHDARGPNPEEMRRLTNENQEQDSQGPEGQGTHSDSQQPPTTQSGSSERRAVPGCPQQNPGDPSADELGEGDQ